MTAFDQLLRWMDIAGIAVFAASGALVASRKQLDVVGFVLIAVITGFGGGTLRDLLLGRTRSSGCGRRNCWRSAPAPPCWSSSPRR